MLAFSSKALAVAAIALSLSSSALACLELSGTVGEAIFEGSGSWGNILAIDNGYQTCSGELSEADGNVGMFLKAMKSTFHFLS